MADLAEDLDAPRLLFAAERAQPAVLDATIAISSRDRYDELLVAIRSVFAQEGCSYEVIVIDDGSSDDTAGRVHEAFPGAWIYRSEHSRGLVAQRNFLASAARGRIVVSIDDDDELVDPFTIARTVADFEAGDDIGAVAIPYRELTTSGEWVDLQYPSGSGVEIIDTYIGAAYAVRRDIFLSLGGFWEHMRGEEREFCLRMLAAGYLVRLGTAPPLLHRPSSLRSWAKKSFNSRRSDVLFAYRHVPTPSLPWHMARATANAALAAVTIDRGRYAGDMARGYLAGFRALRGSPRSPVDRATYALHVRLRRRGPLPLEEVRDMLRRHRIGLGRAQGSA